MPRKGTPENYQRTPADPHLRFMMGAVRAGQAQQENKGQGRVGKLPTTLDEMKKKLDFLDDSYIAKHNTREPCDDETPA